jgi:hypothetical protein
MITYEIMAAVMVLVTRNMRLHKDGRGSESTYHTIA